MPSASTSPQENEPDIYNAIKFGALVENVVMDADTREFDFDDGSLAENTRVGYPVEYIPNSRAARHERQRAQDRYLPDRRRLRRAAPHLQAGQEAGHVLLRLRLHQQAGRHGDRHHRSPVPTFSTCFGEPFLPLDPSVYANMLAEKVEKSGANVYLVNTGWNGTGKRMKLSYTRAMVTAALNGDIEKSEFVTDPTFGVKVPTSMSRRALRAADPCQHLGGQGGLRSQGQGTGQELCGELQEVYPHER